MRPFCNETSVLKFLENTLYLVGCVLMTMNPEKEIPYMYRCAIKGKYLEFTLGFPFPCLQLKAGVNKTIQEKQCFKIGFTYHVAS